ncbi:protein RIC-3b [Anarrhichthys ocellatus]|uniref:protein RIC-3b n=1 Tax=Anarrhichthys ocellatus TaxID=433405 RepID=UPI0012ED93FD|nr:protein RIC-3-like [Anarrhichthys ocellatus]
MNLSRPDMFLFTFGVRHLEGLEITSKGTNKPTESRFSSVRSENKKRKITDFELAQLQEKLRETELVMENIVSNVNHSPDRVKGVTADQEESLLQQLTEITRVMQEGQLMEDLAPQKKTQEDWEVPADYPEEPEQQREHSRCCCQHSQQPHSPQTETERTQADGADLEDAPGEVAGGGDAAEGAEDLNKGREPDFTAVSEEDAGPERDLGANVEADASERREGAGKIEPEVTLTVTSVMEQEQVEELTGTTETEASCSAVRRRNNKRRRAKKASH